VQVCCPPDSRLTHHAAHRSICQVRAIFSHTCRSDLNIFHFLLPCHSFLSRETSFCALASPLLFHPTHWICINPQSTHAMYLDPSDQSPRGADPTKHAPRSLSSMSILVRMLVSYTLSHPRDWLSLSYFSSNRLCSDCRTIFSTVVTVTYVCTQDLFNSGFYNCVVGQSCPMTFTWTNSTPSPGFSVYKGPHSVYDTCVRHASICGLVSIIASSSWHICMDLCAFSLLPYDIRACFMYSTEVDSMSICSQTCRMEARKNGYLVRMMGTMVATTCPSRARSIQRVLTYPAEICRRTCTFLDVHSH
jgi:hypothetical protein